MTREWGNRIVGHGTKPASQFMPNDKNWRLHPKSQQDALRGALNEVGWVAPVVENIRSGMLVDGHERVWQALQNNDSDVPYIEVDLSEEEEAYVLATLDPIGAMAQADAKKVDELLAEVKTQEEGIEGLLLSMAQTLPPEFREYDETVEGTVEYITCPECGHKWPK